MESLYIGAAALVIVIAIVFISRERRRKLELALIERDNEISLLKEKLASEIDSGKRVAEEMKRSYESSLAEIRRSSELSLKAQTEMLRNSMKAQTEEILRKREEELDRRARETFASITGNLEKDVKSMKEAFELNKMTHTRTSAELKEKIAEAVRSLEESSSSIGKKADSLADALRGNNKMQGCWGETILQKLFDNEGFREGVNYDREETLRDMSGKVLKNEDSGSMMRPDYIIHFPDGNDVVIDAKVSLSAYSDYLQASDEDTRKDAAARNLQSVREQVRRLSGKNYSSYLVPGHRMLDFTLMFVPNYASLQLAYSEDPNVWRDAFSKNVLITTEETLMPFLRMITIAWRNTEQVRNQEKIIAGASRMIDRVADLVKHFESLGRKLEDAQAAYMKCDSKLRDSGQSIVKSARDVVSLGVPETGGKQVTLIEMK